MSKRKNNNESDMSLTEKKRKETPTEKYSLRALINNVEIKLIVPFTTESSVKELMIEVQR